MADHWVEFTADARDSAMTKAHQVVLCLFFIADLVAMVSAVNRFGWHVEVILIGHLMLAASWLVVVWVFYGAYSAIADKRDTAQAEVSALQKTLDDGERKRRIAVELQALTKAGTDIRRGMLEAWGEDKKADANLWLSRCNTFMARDIADLAAHFLNDGGLITSLSYNGDHDRSNWVTMMDRRLQRLGEITMKVAP